MTYIFCVITIAALAVLYRFFPGRKIFVAFCVVLLAIFCAAIFIRTERAEKNITLNQLEELRQQQQIFINWYSDYQKNIEQMDRNWQTYYSIVDTLKNAEVYELTTYEQLSELELSTIDEQYRIHEMAIPPGLKSEQRLILEEIISKTKSYVDAQTKTISLVRAAANPELVTDLNQLNQKIKDISIRESPTGLFIASEVASIREKLTVPGEAAE